MDTVCTILEFMPLNQPARPSSRRIRRKMDSIPSDEATWDWDWATGMDMDIVMAATDDRFNERITGVV